MGEERIPTIPQENEGRIPTIPQSGEERIPTLPQDMDRIATMPQGELGEDGRVATLPQQNLSKKTIGGKLVLVSETSFLGEKGGNFVIDPKKVISSDSGESQIYACHKKNEDDEYVARILIAITPNSEIEKKHARDKVIKVLDLLCKNKESHILPLIDYGTLSINEKEYYVEIYPFCKDGDLGNRKGKINYKELHDEIVPAINEALNEFHMAGFVHRDVKPDNIYKYNGRIVIGDFGITCDLREDGFATDRHKTGTLGYYAPELMSQAAIKASDYYSFGQTVWTLYSGEMMYQNILRRYKEFGIEEQRNQVNFAMLNSVYYGLDEIGEDDSFLEILVRGLLQYDPSSRFDYDKVNRWIKNDKSISHEIVKSDNKSMFATPFKYNGIECWNNTEVYNVLIHNWENAKELLYSGGLKGFYVSLDYGVSSEIDKIMKKYSTINNYIKESEIDILNDVGLSKFFMQLDDRNTLVWRTKEYDKFSDLLLHIREYMDDNGEIVLNSDVTDLLSSELLGYWYQLKTSKNGKYDNYLADTIANIRTLACSESLFIKSIAYATTYYTFCENDENIVFNGCNTLEELANQLLESKGIFCTEINSIMHNPLFYGFIFALGYEENARYLIQNLGNEEYVYIEMFFDFLTTQINDKNLLDKIVKAYIQRGPSAYLIWTKNNMNMYECNGDEANTLKCIIEKFEIEGETVSDVRKKFEELNKLLIQFRNLFIDNLFLAAMGFDKDKSCVTSTKMDAYWHDSYLGRAVPLGYGSYIKIGGIESE